MHVTLPGSTDPILLQFAIKNFTNASFPSCSVLRTCIIKSVSVITDCMILNWWHMYYNPEIQSSGILLTIGSMQTSSSFLTYMNRAGVLSSNLTTKLAHALTSLSSGDLSVHASSTAPELTKFEHKSNKLWDALVRYLIPSFCYNINLFINHMHFLMFYYGILETFNLGPCQWHPGPHALCFHPMAKWQNTIWLFCFHGWNILVTIIRSSLTVVLMHAL